ncbi:hypothetical protein MtrunA17_Chr4g0024911 [Medicago truncatula]|uniref:Transmembrane protein n=1 Tax=Medicago truncatula TaxID=3880 RepID=A0A396I7Y7_MEDTR|nr:hypothetical protein MtrunA17_Chr4g0024911 [Medicago truncatula]
MLFLLSHFLSLLPLRHFLSMLPFCHSFRLMCLYYFIGFVLQMP